MSGDFFAVVMAGGGGTRFWPASRQARPKQFLSIASERPLLVEAVERACAAASPERILVITHIAQAEGSRSLLPDLPAGAVVAEPQARNTAPCIGLAALLARARAGGDPVLGVFPADQTIRPLDRFLETVRTAVEAAREPGVIVTVGIRPDRPATGYGYIQHGAACGGGEEKLHEVAAFREKPDRAAAESFLHAGGYSWNAGIFFLRASTALEELGRHAPAIRAALDALRPSLGTPAEATALKVAYEAMPAISFDYAVMEKAARVRVVEAAFEWDDLGSWAALARHLPADAEGNVAQGPALFLDARGNTVSSERLVTLVGVEGLVVVETPDAVLVCPRDRAEEVKRIVELLRKQGRTELL